MTAVAITGMGLTGVLRLTRVYDNLAHVEDHIHTDETSGTWTGLACPGHGLPRGADVDSAVLRHLAAQGGEIADLIWEAPDELAAEHAHVFLAAMHALTPATPSAPTGSGRTSGRSGPRPGQRTTRYSSSCNAPA
jgi:hypothetical protein